MLTHIVCFKYRSEIDARIRHDHREQLRALAQVPGVVALRVGEDVVRSPRSYDTALVVTFSDRAALDAYQRHSDHVPVARHGASLCESIVAVDFEE